MDERVNQQGLNSNDIAWLAGIWDGEGYIGTYWKKLNGTTALGLIVRASVKNTDVFMIKKISEILYQANIGFHYQLEKNSTSLFLTIGLRGKGTIKKLLMLLLPYLITKKYQALLMLELIDYRESMSQSSWEHDSFGNSIRKKPKNWVMNDSKILELIDKIKQAKKQTILPSETRRIAGKPLVNKGVS
jgi:hypothetical protein